VLYHERLCVAASHTHRLSMFRKSSTVPIANFLPVLPNPVTVYISFFPKHLHTVLIVSGKDNILTNSLISSSHSTKTVLSIDVCLDFQSLISLYIFVAFVSPCVITVVCYVFNVFFFLIFCVHVTVCVCHTALKGYLT